MRWLFPIACLSCSALVGCLDDPSRRSSQYSAPAPSGAESSAGPLDGAARTDGTEAANNPRLTGTDNFAAAGAEFTEIYRLRAGDEPMVPVAISEDALERMTKYANLRDEQSFARMVAKSEVILVAAGTKCTLSDPGFLTHEVRIDEGPQAGQYGFVPAEFAQRVSAEEQYREMERKRAKRESDERNLRAMRDRLAAEEEAKFRAWTSAGGKYTREAKLVSYMNGRIILENREGKRTKLELSKLSDDDRQYVDRWRKKRP